MFDGPLPICRRPSAVLALVAIVATASTVATPVHAFGLSGTQFVEGLNQAGDTVKAAEEAQRQDWSHARQVVDDHLEKAADKVAHAIERGLKRAGGKAWDSLAKSDSKVGELAKKAAKRWGPAVRKGLRLVGPVGKVIDTADAGLTVGNTISRHVVIPLIDGHHDRKSRELGEQILRDAMEIRKRGEFRRKLDDDIAAYKREARAMDEVERRLYAPERSGTAGDGATGARTAAIGSDPWADDRRSRVADPWAPEGKEEDPWAPDDAGPGPGTAGNDPPDGRVPTDPGDDFDYVAALRALDGADGTVRWGLSEGNYTAKLTELERREAERRATEIAREAERRAQQLREEVAARQAEERRARRDAEQASRRAALERGAAEAWRESNDAYQSPRSDSTLFGGGEAGQRAFNEMLQGTIPSMGRRRAGEQHYEPGWGSGSDDGENWRTCYKGCSPYKASRRGQSGSGSIQ